MPTELLTRKERNWCRKDCVDTYRIVLITVHTNPDPDPAINKILDAEF
jgi:hypothetical protein